ncbi:hypothetical protein Ctob_016112, partial [Chrysochromulina tobinii]
MKIGHDAQEASKSATVGYRWNERNEFVRDESTKFTIPIGSNHADIELAVAITYRYLGVLFGAGLDQRETEEACRARTAGLLRLVGNLGCASCKQLVSTCNTLRQGNLIFVARTITFHDEPAKALDASCTRLLANTGNRLSHTRRVGAFLPAEAGGLGLRFTMSTLVAGALDEIARAFGGKRGEPARATVIALLTTTAVRFGWRGPSPEEPTPFDYSYPERWREHLSRHHTGEAIIDFMLQFELRWRGTGVEESSLDAAQAREAESLSARRIWTGPELIEISEITPSMRLHGLGILAVADLHAGQGVLMSAARVADLYPKGQQTGQHVIHDLETISSWMDEAARSRWEPSSFNKFLERRLGAEEADKIMRWASKSVTSQGPQGADTKRFEQQATRCRCLVAELLLGEYAALKSHGRNPASTNLQEDHTSRARMRFARDCRARRLTITLREPDAEKKKTGDDEGGRSASKRVRMAPAPKMADGQRIPARDAREVFDCVAWDQPGQLWCSHLHPEHELGVFETHPQAHVDARLCGFIRDELSESEHGRTVQNAYGGVLKIKIDKGEAAMQWAELNKDLLEELGRLELSRLDEGRRPYRLVAATDGSRKETKRRSISLAVADGGSTTVAPPRVASGVYYGQQPEGSAVPIAEGLALPAGYDINMAEHMALIVALRRHAALILEVSLDVLLEHLDAGREDELLPVLAPAEGTEELDLLVIMDSENVANSMGTAWEAQDLWLLRGETYGFRLEEALLLRRLIQRRGGLVDIARMSAHVGLTWNVYADAVAVAALQLDCAIEPRLRVTRALATITCKTGAGRTWQALTPEIWSAGELDGRVSLKVRAHVDQALRRKLIEKQVRVYTAAWGGSTLLQNLVPQACAHALDVTTCPRQGLLQVLTQDLTHLQMVGPELLEGRKYAMPIFDYDRTGHDPAAGHQAFDRPIVQALAVQAGGGFGNSTQLTRTGMRQVLRNFDQAAIAELSCRDIEDKHAAAGEALRISKCLACGDEVRCDVFHFLECRVGASIELKEAIDKILEQQILILNLPDVGSMEAGDADYLWELTWARVSLWFERLPGELGRYRRYQAARALSGMLSAPPDSIIAATASDWVASGRDRDKGGAGDEEEEEKDREDGDGIGDEHERTSKARKLARRYYVHRTVALNTLLIDHLKREYEIWLMRLTSGATALRASFGADYQAVARIDDIKLSLEYLTGTYLFADGRPSETMTKEEFDARRLTLDAGRFVYEISGETQSIRNDKGDQREQRIMERDSSKREQER